jgi:hypothetical protein
MQSTPFDQYSLTSRLAVEDMDVLPEER